MSLMPIIPGSQATAWRLDNAVSDGVSLDTTSGTTLAGAGQIEWKPDGTRLFVPDVSGGGKIHFWDCSTAWDLSTAVYVSSIQLDGFGFNEVRFNAAGTLLVGDFGPLRGYTLSSAYGGTATLRDSGALAADSNSFFFNADGTAIYYCGGFEVDLYTKPLSTAYDVDTLGSESLVTGSVFDDGRMTVSRSGTRILVATGSAIKEYGGNAYDFANFTLRETYTSTAIAATYAGNGTKLYALSSASVITQFSTVG